MPGQVVREGSPMVTPGTSRPGGVTLVIVLMWINAIIEIIAGILTVLASGDVEHLAQYDQAQAVVLTIGIIAIVFGLITIALALGLARGGSAARVIVTVVVVLQILADTWELAVRAHGGFPWLSVLAILFWLLILALLWTSRASAFFRGY